MFFSSLAWSAPAVWKSRCFLVDRTLILKSVPLWACPLVLSRLPLIAVAYLEGTLAIYDLSTQVLRHSCQHEVTYATGTIWQSRLLHLCLMTWRCPRPSRWASFTCSGRSRLPWCPRAAWTGSWGCGTPARATWLPSIAATRRRSSISPSTGAPNLPERSSGDALLKCPHVSKPHCGFQFQGGVCGGDGVRRQPGQSLLPPEAWPIKRERKKDFWRSDCGVQDF